MNATITEPIESKQDTFVGYEYKEITTTYDKASFLLDSYENFGWEVDKNLSEILVRRDPQSRQNKVILRLKRNRKLVNKMELTRLQRNFEACVDEIATLENSKASTATVHALVIGMIGTAFMAGSVFAVTAQPPHIMLCILLAIPAFIGWVLPLFIYKKTVAKKTEKVSPLIEQKYEEIYEICKKGNKLLH